MAATAARPLPLLRSSLRWLHAGWHIVFMGALLAVVALAPSSYRGGVRTRVAQQVVQSTLPVLPWFALIAMLISVVITRIVLVTAQSYGLTQYALETVVRVLVLELIPLTVALFVAVRVTLPAAAALAAMRAAGQLAGPRDVARSTGLGEAALRLEVLPRALAGVLAMLLLTAVSGALALALAYVMAYGASPWALGRYTRQVGHVFSPEVTLIFVLKTLAFAAVVAVIPVGSALYDRSGRAVPLSVELQGLVRMFIALLVVEVLSLLGNYS